MDKKILEHINVGTRSPGPAAYCVKPTIGKNATDPSIEKNPAYSIGRKHKNYVSVKTYLNIYLSFYLISQIISRTRPTSIKKKSTLPLHASLVSTTRPELSLCLRVAAQQRTRTGVRHERMVRIRPTPNAGRSVQPPIRRARESPDARPRGL